MNKTVSPSRRYVIACNKFSSNKFGYGGYYFELFTLPETIKENDSDSASWFFSNKIDLTPVIDRCYSLEDFENIRISSNSISLEEKNRLDEALKTIKAVVAKYKDVWNEFSNTTTKSDE